MKRPTIVGVVALLGIAAATVWFSLQNSTPRRSGPLPHEVYVWQRAWNDAVLEAVTNHGPAFTNLVVLKAEISWGPRGPDVILVPVDYKSLALARRPVGIALRIGAYAGPFVAGDEAAEFVSRMAVMLIDEARQSGCAPGELQIDFDCAESKLDGYRVWVEAIHSKISPVPVTITALPSWLKQPSFRRLAAATDGYVLQVHSFERPKSIESPFSLCDPAQARDAVERAGRLGTPFRVALPTYGYLLAFDRDGRFVGLSAEGPGRSWPEGVQVREVRADPVAMSELARSWTTNRPAALRGIIWYRLPVSGDNFNWRWPTLAAIVASRSLRDSVRCEPRRVEAGLVEIDLVNDGELDISSRLAVEVRWSREGEARLVAGDGLHGFTMLDAGTSTARFQNPPTPGHLPAGTRQTVGWLRFDRDCEVQVEVKRL